MSWKKKNIKQTEISENDRKKSKHTYIHLHCQLEIVYHGKKKLQTHRNEMKTAKYHQ